MFRIRLKQLREAAGLSQAALAEILGVAQSTVGMWENGKNNPTRAKLIQLANTFNVSTDYLIGLTDEAAIKKAPDDGGQRMDRIREQIVMALGQVDDHEAAMVYGYIQALKENRKDREVPNQ